MMVLFLYVTDGHQVPYIPPQVGVKVRVLGNYMKIYYVF